VPELPEVETTARGLRERIVGRRILAAGGMDWERMLPNATPALVEAAVVGRTVELVDRRGKYLLIGLSGDVWLGIHRKMSGNLVVRPAGVAPVLHTHLVLGLDDGTALDFVDPRKFGRIYLFLGHQDLDDFLATRLGPEPLGELSAEALGRLLQGRRGRLKSLLLDQRFLAGIGNLYADEILWAARLHPERSAASLTSRERGRLLEAIRRVLDEAIRRRGTSLSDYVDAAGEPGDNQDFLQVYGRAGLPCPRCTRPIERRVIAQRGTWLCPRCQRLPRG
jgi:formamidopyrimidine-DNA glycosylase